MLFSEKQSVALFFSSIISHNLMHIMQMTGNTILFKISETEEDRVGRILGGGGE